MPICACGCNQEIPPRPHHKYHPPKYLPGHYGKTGNARRGSGDPKNKVPPGTLCGCGCGQEVPVMWADGKPKVPRRADGVVFLHGHNMRGKKGSKGEVHNWRGGRIIRRGYVLLYMPEYPGADSKGYIPEHRVVLEKALGRPLGKEEVGHHVNEDTMDNRRANLIVLSRADHSRLHGGPAKYATKESRSKGGKMSSAAKWS